MVYQHLTTLPSINYLISTAIKFEPSLHLSLIYFDYQLIIDHFICNLQIILLLETNTITKTIITKLYLSKTNKYNSYMLPS